MEINTEYLNQNYEEIWETTTTKGVPIPYLLKNNVDKEKLTETDIETLNLSEKTKDKLGEAYIERRRKETTIYRENKGVRKRQELIEEYMEDELIDWIKQFPQYKELIISQ